MYTQIDTQPNEKRCNRTEMRHILNLSPACPVSQNPRPGSKIIIKYEPAEKILEVASLLSYVESYKGGRGEIRSMEGMIQAITQDCANSVGVPVYVKAKLLLDPSQRMIVKTSALVQA